MTKNGYSNCKRLLPSRTHHRCDSKCTLRRARGGRCRLDSRVRRQYRHHGPGLAGCAKGLRRAVSCKGICKAGQCGEGPGQHRHPVFHGLTRRKDLTCTARHLPASTTFALQNSLIALETSSVCTARTVDGRGADTRVRLGEGPPLAGTGSRSRRPPVHHVTGPASAGIAYAVCAGYNG